MCLDQSATLSVIDNQRWHATGLELPHEQPGPLDALAICREQFRIRCCKAVRSGLKAGMLQNCAQLRQIGNVETGNITRFLNELERIDFREKALSEKRL